MTHMTIIDHPTGQLLRYTDEAKARQFAEAAGIEVDFINAWGSYRDASGTTVMLAHITRRYANTGPITIFKGDYSQVDDLLFAATIARDNARGNPQAFQKLRAVTAILEEMLKDEDEADRENFEYGKG